jgi:hypothetical protein
MNVYIKSFNRPFYLDRCVRSIKFNVKGADKIIVLDDGTLSSYQRRLAAMHPDIEIRSSGADDGKVKLLREEDFRGIQARYPVASDFWISEMRKEEGPYFFLLEDDAWVSRRLDLDLIETSLRERNAVIYKCWWPDRIRHDVQEVLCAANGQAIEYFDFEARQIRDLYAAWIVAFAVFRVDYWTSNFSGLKRLADEATQLCNVQDYLLQHPDARFAKSRERTVFQGWAVPGRSTPEYYDKGLKQHLYMDALNDSWFSGQFNVAEGYPFDFSDEYLVSLFRERIPSEAIDVWKDWKAREVRYFY